MAERTCKNCGASMAPHEKSCPSCGRLAIDRDSARLGARPLTPTKPIEPEKKREDAGGGAPPADTRSASGDDSGGSDEEVRPDSFYAVAPAPVHTGDSGDGKKTGGCCACAVLVGLIGWIMTLILTL